MPALTALLKKSLRQSANTGRVLREQSVFKCFVILCFALGLEGGLFMLFLDGFRFLDSFGGIGSIIISRLFSVFFLGMGAMLTVSSVVASYVTMFRSDEIPFLVTSPFRNDEIAVYKFLESAALSSWSFFFIVIPFVSAFGLHMRMSPLFAVWTLLLSIPYLLVWAGLGSLAVMTIVRWFPRLRGLGTLALVFVVGMGAVGWWFLRTVYQSADTASFDISRLVPGFRLASNALLPSWWYAESVVTLSRGGWFRGAMLAGVLCSSAAVILLAVEWLGRRTFYETWQRVCGSRNANDRSPVLFPWLPRSLRWLPGDIRAMVMKDVRLFFRDPMQWSQALVFFGLLGLYFANLRSFRYEALPGHWKSLVSFLNVFSVSAVMCSLGSRFIYPQLSLEGQGFWVIGLSPTTMTRILLTKFVLALGSLLTVSILLILLSTHMLSITHAARTVSLVLMASVATAVTALSCGLGAVFLDLRQRNPSAIVSGFGGTLNLVLSLSFMLAAILPFGLLFHLHSRLELSDAVFRHGIVLSWVWLAGITLVFAVAPLWTGVRSLQQREF